MAAEGPVLEVPKAPSQMVGFPVDLGEGSTVENLHVSSEGQGRYRVDNSPFYAYDISYRDVVSAKPDGLRLLFQAVLERGGHSTYRVKLPAGASHEDFLARWAALEALGCSYEGSSANPRRLYAIDVPPEADIQVIYELLEDGEADGAWEFEEGHYCNPDDIGPGPGSRANDR
jgi:hypothetical protein